jgi:putative oxidoreductase
MSRSDRAIQISLGLVFLSAGVLKIVDPLAFAVSIARLRIVPMAVVGPAAILLPWIEIVAAASLFVPAYRGAALRLLTALLAVFTALLAIAFAKGTAASCGCFGSADGVLSRADLALARNVLLLALAVIWLRRKPTSPAAPASPA